MYLKLIHTYTGIGVQQPTTSSVDNMKCLAKLEATIARVHQVCVGVCVCVRVYVSVCARG